jgi:uncharacterized membrane protein
MTAQVLTIIGSVLAIIIGLWKFFRGKAAEKVRKAQEANNEIKQGVDNRDPNLINSGNSDLNRMPH